MITLISNVDRTPNAIEQATGSHPEPTDWSIIQRIHSDTVQLNSVYKLRD